jgi:hypothetical protein
MASQKEKRVESQQSDQDRYQQSPNR